MKYSLEQMRQILEKGALHRAATAPPPIVPPGIPADVPQAMPPPGMSPTAPQPSPGMGEMLPGAPPPMDPAMMGGQGAPVDLGALLGALAANPQPGGAGGVPPVPPGAMAPPMPLGGMPPGPPPPMPAEAGEASEPPVPEEEIEEADKTKARKGESVEAMLRELLKKVTDIAERVGAVEEKLADVTAYDFNKDLEEAPPLPEPENSAALDLTNIGEKKQAQAEESSNSGGLKSLFSRVLGLHR